MPASGSQDGTRDLREHAERIEMLRAAFTVKMQALQARQRTLLEKVFARLDQEKAVQIRKSLEDAQR